MLSMKRILVLLMLCLLPLQTSWATVANYCGHEGDKTTHHFGHHDDEHKVSPDTFDDSMEAGQSHPIQGSSDSNPNSSDHSHLSSFLGVLGVYTLFVCAPLQSSLCGDDQSYSFLPADKPARPNWFVTA